jgi:hypothetical protein
MKSAALLTADADLDAPTPAEAFPRKNVRRAHRPATGPGISRESTSASPRELPSVYRERASQLLRYAPAAAEAFNEAAELLEAAFKMVDAEPLTPEQVEAEKLCSAETVRRHVREHKIENVGTPGRIKIRRSDVPARRGQRSFAELAREVARSSR